MGKPIRVLIVEDSPDDTELLMRELQRGGFEPTFERVETAPSMKDALERQTWDIVLSDYSLPCFSGTDALKQLQRSGLDLPFIIVSGAIGEDTAVASMKAGAHDYIMKNNLTQLVPAIERELNEAKERKKGKQSEKALSISENRYKMLLENLPQRIFYKDVHSRYVSCNESFARDLKIKPDEIEGKTDYDFFPGALAEKYREEDKKIIHLERTVEAEEKYLLDGRERLIHTVRSPLKDENGIIIGILGIFWDITEKIAFQMETLRTRHLASLGELATGVAHEINNPINTIINYAQILVNEGKKENKNNEIAARIIKEGDRIAGIVESLLSFARPLDKKDRKTVAYVQEILSDTLNLIEAQLRKERIKIKLDIPRDLPEISANPQQIQQVFMNIISNARYSLNQKYQEVDENKIIEISGDETTIGNTPYVRVTFYDHGTGIPANILDKVLDPFFTTKPKGKGTGLGLSISHGIVSDHGGKLTIDSKEGEFTKAVVVLPVMTKDL